jgi:hypothetical protein
MELRPGRSIEIDFFRGVVLIVIALDHMPGSVLSHFTLHTYALCDSAEVFVFLGGYASASAYVAVTAHRGAQAARIRFFRRCWEIYRAYLLTAVLTLVAGAVLALFRLNPAMVDLSGWLTFSSRPLRTGLDVVSLRWQPYLSSVLPMYMIFALCVPLAVRIVQRSAATAIAASLGLWALARPLAGLLALESVADWAFNPFAWQLMFMLGMLCRLRPISDTLLTSDAGRWITRAACGAVLGFALLKLLVLTQPMPGHLKQNLAMERVINFIAIAWLTVRLVRIGSVAWIARRLPAIVTVGRTGLVCFVADTVVSLIVDTATPHTWTGPSGWLAGLAGDLAAILALLFIARGWSGWRLHQSHAAVNAAGRK